MNKDIFIKVINNKVIFSLIFNHIHYIHKDIIKSENANINIFKWSEILNKPHILAYYNYEKEFKQYYSNNEFYSPRNDPKTHHYVLYNLISTNNLHLLKYLLEDLNVDYQYLRQIKSYKGDSKGDLLYISLKLNKSEIVNYLTTSPIISKKIEWNYKRAMKAIYNLKDIELFKYVFNNKIGIENVDKEDLTSIAEQSSFHGRLDIINYLLDNIIGHNNGDDYNALYRRMVIKAVQGGHLELLELFYQRGYLETCKEENLLNDALMKNHLHLLDWLNEKHNRIHDEDEGNYYAICSGNLELVKWMSKNRPDGFTKKSMSYAASNCYLDIVQWLHFNRTEGCYDDTIYQCLYSSKFDIKIFKWLLDNGIVSEILSSEDAENFNFDRLGSQGSIELIDYMSKHGFNDRFTSDLMDTASAYGHLELVKWLHENRTEGCTFEALSQATSRGQIEVVEWLIKNKKEIIYEVDDEYGLTIMDDLAYDNRLDMMKLLSFTISDDTMKYAARNANLEMVKWLLDRPLCHIGEDAIFYAAGNGDLEMLQVFEESDKMESFDMCNNLAIKCASNGHIDTLQWLYERDAYFTSDVWVSAAQNDQIETLIWLNDNITTSCSVSILDKIDNPTIINWFKENRSEFQQNLEEIIL